MKCCSVAVIVLALCVGAAVCISLEHLDDVMRYEVQKFCDGTKCFSSISSSQCPYGTVWVEGVAVSGCCGACVNFKKNKKKDCTGKIDPESCNGEDAGYGSCSLVNNKNRARTADLGVAQEDDVDMDNNIVPSSWCDYGMYCTRETCEVDPSTVRCSNTQEAYDKDIEEEGNYVAWRDEYRWRPNCKLDQTFAPKQCKGSANEDTKSCICVDPNGNTLPGKAFNFQDELFTEMNCLCSRRVWELQRANIAAITLHCQENGNYEPLQCADGWCYCVHPENGTIRGYQMPEAAINLLPCFNATTIGESYLRQCESQSYAHDVFTRDMRAKGVLISPVSPVNCDRDGAYAGQQCIGSSCHCYSKYNKDCLSTGTIGCDCIRDILTFDEYGMNYNSLQCSNLAGDYLTFQKLIASSAGYIVDKEGTRISGIVRDSCKGSLHEYQLGQCQSLGNSMTEDYCNQTCTGLGDVQCPDEAYLFYPGGYEPNLLCNPI